MTNKLTSVRIVTVVNGSLAVVDVPPEKVRAAMAERGAQFTANHWNHRTRAELQGAPMFSGFCGPMWDGDALRYESVEAYRILSV